MGEQQEQELDIKKMDFVYESAVEYLKEIRSANEIINTRITLLLSYLVLAIGSLTDLLLRGGLSCFIETFSILIIVIYFLIVIYISSCLLFPKKGITSFSEPEVLLKEKVINLDLGTIKFWECKKMDERITQKLEDQFLKVKGFRWAFIFTLIAPAFLWLISFLWFLWRSQPY